MKRFALLLTLLALPAHATDGGVPSSFVFDGIVPAPGRPPTTVFPFLQQLGTMFNADWRPVNQALQDLRAANGIPRAIETFGAVGDGVHDDGPAINAAFAWAYANKRPIAFNGKTYLTYQELLNQGIEVTGTRGVAGTVIAANAPMTSVMHVTGVTKVSDIAFEGGHVANYTIKLEGTSYSRFQNVAADGAIFDGWFLVEGNDFVQLDNCIARDNGKIYASTGRASSTSAAQKVSLGAARIDATAGSSTLYRDGGTVDFTTLGIRPGDFIGLGDGGPDSDWVQIASATSNTLTVNDIYQAASLRTRWAQPFAIFVGDGYHEQPAADNNRNNIEHFYAANNAGAGIVFRGLYGGVARTVQLDANGTYAIEIGLYNGSPGAPQGTVIDTLYSEGFDQIPQDGSIFASNCNGLTVNTTNIATYPGGAVRMANPSVCYGFVMNDSALAGHFYGVGSVANDVPTTQLANGVQFAGQHSIKWEDTGLAPGDVHLAGVPFVSGGRAAIAVGASTLRISNPSLTSTSMVLVNPEVFNTGLTSYITVCGSGYCDVTGNANALTTPWIFNYVLILRD